MVASGQAAVYPLPAASTRGCRAVEPAAVMLPATQLTAVEPPPDASVEAGAEASLDTAAVSAAVGAVVTPLLAQAARTTLASKASVQTGFARRMVTGGSSRGGARLGRTSKCDALLGLCRLNRGPVASTDLLRVVKAPLTVALDRGGSQRHGRSPGAPVDRFPEWIARIVQRRRTLGGPG